MKVAGIINTPVWLEYGVPIASLITGIFALYHDVMDSINKIAVEVAKTYSKIDNLGEKINSLDCDVNLIKKKISV